MGQKVSGEFCSTDSMDGVPPSPQPLPTMTLMPLCIRKGNSKRSRIVSMALMDLTANRQSKLDFLLDRRRSDDDLSDLQLANAWSPVDRSTCIRVKRDDPLTFRRLPVQGTTDAIRAKVGYSRGLHAWTIRWKADQRGSHAVVGVATAQAPLQQIGYKCLVGGNAETWGWDLVKNRLWHNGKSHPGVMCLAENGHLLLERSASIPDDITVILDMDAGTMAFSIEGHYLGVAFTGLKGKTLYPAVSAVWGHCEVTIRYIGSIEPNPSSLAEICRGIIRQQIGRHRLEEGVERLPLPPLLIQFLR